MKLQNLLPQARLSALFLCMIQEQSWKLLHSLALPFMPRRSLRASSIWVPTYWEGRTWCCVYSSSLAKVFLIVGRMLLCPCGFRSLQQTYFRSPSFYFFQVFFSSTVIKTHALVSLCFGTNHHRNNSTSHGVTFSAVSHYIYQRVRHYISKQDSEAWGSD